MMHRIKIAAAFATNHFRYWYNKTSATLNRLRKSQHQLTSTTEFDRYPELFQQVANNNSFADPIRILSFGCSTGEECLTLRHYFPGATIVGVDISSSNLRKATSKNRDPSIQFRLSSAENISRAGKYDVIFCLSVLCRWEDTKNVKNCEKIYPFLKFEETVRMLAGNLKPGGLMVVYNSNFRFEDTEVAKGFQVLDTPSIKDSGFVHKFDQRNNRVHENHVSCIYRKL